MIYVTKNIYYLELQLMGDSESTTLILCQLMLDSVS